MKGHSCRRGRKEASVSAKKGRRGRKTREIFADSRCGILKGGGQFVKKMPGVSVGVSSLLRGCRKQGGKEDPPESNWQVGGKGLGGAMVNWVQAGGYKK